MRIAAILLLAAVSAVAQTPDPASPPQGQGGPGPERGQRCGPGVGGAITAISGDSLALKTMDGRSVAVKLTGTTRFRKDQQDAQPSDFKVGDMVMVRGERTGEDTFVASGVMSRSGMGMVGGGLRPSRCARRWGRRSSPARSRRSTA